jgi:hypothetical protein
VLAAARSDPTGLVRALDQTTIDEVQIVPGLSPGHQESRSMMISGPAGFYGREPQFLERIMINTYGDKRMMQLEEHLLPAARPESWQGRLELAKSLYGQGEFVLGLRELDSEPVNFPDTHLVRGNVLVCLGRNQEAGEAFRAFLQQDPDDPRAQTGQSHHGYPNATAWECPEHELITYST